MFLFKMMSTVSQKSYKIVNNNKKKMDIQASVRLSDLPWTCLSACLSVFCLSSVCLSVFTPHLYNTSDRVKCLGGDDEWISQDSHIKQERLQVARCKWRCKVGISYRSTCQWSSLSSRCMSVCLCLASDSKCCLTWEERKLTVRKKESSKQ